MNPEFLNQMSWEMAEVYGAITDQILVNLAHYFPYYDSRNFPRSSITYQADMLAQMGQVNKETMQIIRNGLKGASPILSRMLEQVIVDSVGAVNPSLANAVAAGILKPAGIPAVAPNQMRAFNLYYTQAANKLNLVNTVMLESTRNAYQATVSDIAARVQATQTALDIGAGEVITGVSSWNQATQHAIKRMQDKGITGFIDHGGHRWSAEAYVAMDVRTTMFNTARAAVWETNQNFGNDLYSVSYHNGARPLCYPWQNKVISATDNARVVPDLDGYEVQVYRQSDTSYGEPAGLFGINCGHYPTPFIPGVSLIEGNPQSEEDNARTYAESQEQRKLERKIREEKRDLLMLKAQDAPEEMIKAQQERIRATSQDIADFCDSTGRARHRDREGVYTERSFPSANTYDVRAFEQSQKQMIEGFFSVGGGQVEYSFGTMTPNAPIPMKPRPVTTQQSAPPPSWMKHGKPFEDQGYRAPQRKQFEDAKQALDNAPESARRAWSKVADRLKAPLKDQADPESAFYRSITNDVHFGSWKKAFEASGYQLKNTVFFHEYGHNIDALLGNGKHGGYLSETYKGGLFGKTIKAECEKRVTEFYLQHNGFKDAYDAVKAAQNGYGGMGFTPFVRQMLRGVMPAEEWRAVRDALPLGSEAADSVLRPLVDKWLKPHFETELRTLVHHKDVGQAFVAWVKGQYTLKQRADVSDMFERFMYETYGILYPFDIGHGKDRFGNVYCMDTGATEREAFAEMFSALVTGGDSHDTIKEFFPETWAVFEEMLGSVI